MVRQAGLPFENRQGVGGDRGCGFRGIPTPWFCCRPTSTGRTFVSSSELQLATQTHTPDQDWRFIKSDPPGNAESLLYDVRGQGASGRGAQPAPLPPVPSEPVIKSWVLPSGNDFVNDPAKRAKRPPGNPGESVAYIAATFDDSSWRKVDLPHDYAVEGPFSTSGGGGMGRLPSAGVVWYRRNLSIPASSTGKSLFLDVDGAMSYSEVWLNGRFVGGWPYGYASFRLNLTPHAKPGESNVLAIRLDNPPASSRWYPGGGLYRNVWLVETSPVHIGQWGTYVTTPEISPAEPASTCGSQSTTTH